MLPESGSIFTNFYVSGERQQDTEEYCLVPCLGWTDLQLWLRVPNISVTISITETEKFSPDSSNHCSLKNILHVSLDLTNLAEWAYNMEWLTCEISLKFSVLECI